MKTKWFIIPVIALSLGCTRETIDINETHIKGEFTLYATSGEQEETRTVLQQDGRVFWSPGDCITVFYGNIPGKFTSTNTKPAASAEFTGSLGSFTLDGKTEFKAIYPYSDNIVMPSDEGILSIYLPPEQTAVEGTFADDLFICVAKSKDVNLHFYNVCGGVSFSLAREDIKKVVFRGNNKETLAGTMFVDFTADGIPQVIDFTAGRSSVTLSAPDGETLKKGSWYYLVSAPQVLSKGYTMELYTDELVETIISDSSVTIRRSVWGELKDLGSETSVEFGAVDLGLSVKWANMNLGATKPEEYGDYYAWGETAPYYKSLSPLVWKSGKESGYNWPSYALSMGSYRKLTKYNYDSSYGYNGFTDGKTDLDPVDDAAHVNLGGEWRIPTFAEIKELGSNCTWEDTSRNGVDGCLVTGPNGKSIFLPVAGYWDGTASVEAGSSGACWITSLAEGEDESPYRANIFMYNLEQVGYGTGNRYYGLTIRPVCGDFPVESVSLDKTDLEIAVGDEATLTATVLPTNATNKNVTWSSSNKSVATVSSGVIKGVSTGSAIISVKTDNGGKTATCNVIVKENPSSYPFPEAIDLGLSVRWASFNLGASTPEDDGDFFAWGEIEPYYSSLDPLTWKEGKKGGYWWSGYSLCNGSTSNRKILTKYCTNSSYGNNGFTDDKTKLDLEDDAAHVILGGKWRMPSKEEVDELIKECTWEVIKVDEKRGWKVTALNGRSIFIPISGEWSGREHMHTGQMGYGYYWTSTLANGTPTNAWQLHFTYYGTPGSSVNDRYMGLPIRPVKDY